MKKISIIFLFLFIGSSLLHASYMATCELKVKIQKADSSITSKNGGYERIMNFTVLKVRSQGGHSQNHCSNYPGKVFNKPLWDKSKTRLEEVKKGDKRIILYRMESSEMIDENKKARIVSHSIWKNNGWCFWDNFY